MTCTITLRIHDIPMPPTIITENLDEAESAVEQYGVAVFKPFFSSKAQGMKLIEAGDGARAKIEAFQETGNRLLYIQKKETLPGWDLGVAFLGGRYVGTYARVSSKDSWNTTHRAGGTYEKYEPSQQIIALAHRAQLPFDLDFTCVDVALTNDGPIVFEVSAFGGFHGLLDGTGIDAAERISDYVLEAITNNH
jgi:ribosomal protein S6--L-glutamate ligase